MFHRQPAVARNPLRPVVAFLNRFVTRTCFRIASVVLSAADLVRGWTMRLLWRRKIGLADTRLLLAVAGNLNHVAIRLIRLAPRSRNDNEH